MSDLIVTRRGMVFMMMAMMIRLRYLNRWPAGNPIFPLRTQNARELVYHSIRLRNICILQTPGDHNHHDRHHHYDH